MEATAELKAAFAGATVVALGDISAGSAGASKAEDEAKEKLSFFLKISSLLLAFLLWVEGLVCFFAREAFTFFSLVSREKEKVKSTLRVKPCTGWAALGRRSCTTVKPRWTPLHLPFSLALLNRLPK